MREPSKLWDGAVVREWLVRRCEVAKRDQAVADRRGYTARDEYDIAAAEEWVCRTLQFPDCTGEQALFAQRIKALIGQDDYHATGVYDDARFERHVRAQLRKVAKMAKANEGFENKLHYQ
ncbi:MAG: hypothetical protein PSY12_15620 [bacterium]|nr:hypothetical protein [bacterium]